VNIGQIILIILVILVIFLIYEIISSIQIKHKIDFIKQKISKNNFKKNINLFKKRNNKVITSKDQLRSLSRETGGLEVDYKKSQEEAENDKDPWDIGFDEANVSIEDDGEESETGAEFDSSNYKAFIHKKKKGKGKKGKKIGAMTLDKKEGPRISHLEKLNQARKARIDRSEEGVGF
jgi:hypothetical protein